MPSCCAPLTELSHLLRVGTVIVHTACCYHLLISTNYFTFPGKLGWLKGLVRGWGCQGLAVAGSEARSSGQRRPGCPWFGQPLVTGRWRWWLLSCWRSSGCPAPGPAAASAPAAAQGRSQPAASLRPSRELHAKKSIRAHASSAEAQCKALQGLLPPSCLRQCRRNSACAGCCGEGCSSLGLAIPEC